MTHGFDMYRVFISAPGDLEPERQACWDVVSQVNEKEAMPRQVLLVSLGLNVDELIVAFRSAVSENIRKCVYFIQVFEDDWGPRNLFKNSFQLAIECRDDRSLPMRDVVVFLKAGSREKDLAFQKELEDRQDVRIFRFDTLDSLIAQLLGVCSGWVGSILAPITHPGDAP